jgi:hypothetical protein
VVSAARPASPTAFAKTKKIIAGQTDGMGQERDDEKSADVVDSFPLLCPKTIRDKFTFTLDRVCIVNSIVRMLLSAATRAFNAAVCVFCSSSMLSQHQQRRQQQSQKEALPYNPSPHKTIIHFSFYH